MKPGHGEVLIAEGDVEVAGDEERARRGVPAPARRGHVGGRARALGPAGGARRRWSRRSTTIPRDADRVIFFPRAAGGPERARREGGPAMLLASQRHGDRHLRAAVGGRPAAARRRPSSAAGRAAQLVPGRRLRPRPRAPRRAARAPAAALVRQRRGVGDVPRPRLHPGLGRHGPRAQAAATRATTAAPGAPYAYLVYPHKPIVAYLPQTRELLSEYCVAFPDETRPTAPRGCPTPTTCWPSGWR